MDTNYVSHEIYSAPGLIQSNVYQHVALTFDTNSGLAMLYLNGTNVATTNLFLTNGVFTPFVPKTDGDVLLGRDMTLYTNNYFGGEMDEMSIYRRALSGAEIAAIHRVSATATNGLTGKFDPSVTPAVGLAEAEVTFGGVSNLLFGVNNQWEFNSYTFTAASNSLPVQITGLEPGVLLDNFAVSEAPETNLYYLPEQSLDALAGDTAAGNWTLQVWDNRVGEYVTNVDQLVNWELSFILESNAMVAGTLSPETPSSSTVAAGATVYYEVDVPSWAHWATNILVSSDLPVDLLFNPTNLPTGSNPGDLTLLTNFHRRGFTSHRGEYQPAVCPVSGGPDILSRRPQFRQHCGLGGFGSGLRPHRADEWRASRARRFCPVPGLEMIDTCLPPVFALLALSTAVPAGPWSRPADAPANSEQNSKIGYVN